MNAESNAANPAQEAVQDAHVQASVVPSVNASHDATLTTSLAGLVNAQGDVELNQGGAGAVVAQGSVALTQGGAAAIFANKVNADSSGSAVLMGSDVTVSNGWVGFAVASNMQVADDSRVIIGTRGALIIAAAIFGVFGIAAAMALVAGRRVMQWRPKVPVPSVRWRRAGS